MKNLYTLLTFIALVFIASCNIIDENTGSGDSSNDTIPKAETIGVDVENVDDLIAMSPASGAGPVNADSFVDLDGDPATPNAEFTTEVGVIGDEIQILGGSADNARIRIDSIMWKDDGSYDLFEGVEGPPLVLVASNGSVISGNITSDPRGTGFGNIGVRDSIIIMNELPADPTWDMNYNTYFTVIREGVEYGPYVIDPRIRAKLSR